MWVIEYFFIMYTELKLLEGPGYTVKSMSL